MTAPGRGSQLLRNGSAKRGRRALKHGEVRGSLAFLWGAVTSFEAPGQCFPALLVSCWDTPHPERSLLPGNNPPRPASDDSRVEDPAASGSLEPDCSGQA